MPHLALAALAAGLLTALAGCGATAGEPDLIAGKRLFVERCGACHVLERAGTQGTQGPNLDAAFARALDDGFDRDGIEGVVHEQILHPARLPEDHPAYMPPDLVEGEAAWDVAAYVAYAAARPGEDEGLLAQATPGADAEPGSGKALFLQGAEGAQSCASCHTLSDAGSQSTTGPDLDEALQGMDEEAIRRAIVQPDAEVASGFQPGVMPDTYGEALSDEQLDRLVEYLAGLAGG